MSTRPAQTELEELLESDAVGFVDGEEWGAGVMKWAKQTENKSGVLATDGGLAALTGLTDFIRSELIGSGTTGPAAQNIIGNGDRTLNMMNDFLNIRLKLVADGHGDSVDSIIRMDTTVSAAKKDAQKVMQPQLIAEDRQPALKRPRKQAERAFGCVSSLDPHLSCESAASLLPASRAAPSLSLARF